jgi:hypothetical protein
MTGRDELREQVARTLYETGPIWRPGRNGATPVPWGEVADYIRDIRTHEADALLPLFAAERERLLREGYRAGFADGTSGGFTEGGRLFGKSRTRAEAEGGRDE